ncbi:unnamed protein product [Darwinula stevensoni]|uniref:Uncharacterized protein n=1 Tax=Darwinula stevensoni TaxID=69355 RepID=A0A7R9A6C4_9CRUS|nr:unnamed protein product [Darwinula stevensoni]CAG0887356.1 unnamed protein product [Darwinula stevensoni]
MEVQRRVRKEATVLFVLVKMSTLCTRPSTLEFQAVNRDKTLRAMEEENGGLQPSKNTVDGSKVFDSKNVKLKNVEGGLNKSEGESIKKHINVEEMNKQQLQTLVGKEKTRRLAERYGRHEDRSKELEEELMMKHSLLVEAQQRNLELEAALVDTKAQVEEIYKQQTQTLAEKEKTRRLAERYGRHEDRSKELEEKLMMKHSLLVEAQQRNLELEAALVDTKAQIEKMKLQLGGRKDAHSLARTSGCPKDSYDETSIAESCGLQPSISTSANGRSSQITQVWLQSGKTEVENRQCLGDTAASAVSVNDVADKEEDLPLVSQKLRPETRKDGIRLAERIKASAILVRKGTKGNLAVYGLRGTANLVERRVEMAKYNVGILFGT